MIKNKSIVWGDFIAIVSAGLLIFSAFGYVLWDNIIRDYYNEASYVQSQGYFAYKSKDQKTQIKFTYQESAEISGRIHQTIKEKNPEISGGVFIQLHYLEEKNYKKFTNKYGDTKKCPASFYNSYMKHTFLLSSNQICREKLNSLKDSDWTQFRIKGKFAKFSEGFNSKGKIAFPRGDYRFFVVEDC